MSFILRHSNTIREFRSESTAARTSILRLPSFRTNRVYRSVFRTLVKHEVLYFRVKLMRNNTDSQKLLGSVVSFPERIHATQTDNRIKTCAETRALIHTRVFWHWPGHNNNTRITKYLEVCATCVMAFDVLRHRLINI